MFNAFDQVIQLYNLTYSQLLLSQLNNVQDEPLDLSLPKHSTSTSSDSCSSPCSSICTKSSPSPNSPTTNNSMNSLVVESNDSPPTTDMSSDDSILNYMPNMLEIANSLRTGKPLLWHFLYHLLENPFYVDIISWIDREDGHFQIKQPNTLAKIWGKCEANPNMTYECLSRSLRSYYQKVIITKKSRLQYQFSHEALTSLKHDSPLLLPKE